jgi:predicted DNA-binding transcriptional regulator AlpA
MANKLADALAYPPRLFGVDRAAAYLGMSTATFLRLVDEGVLPQATRINSLVRWDRLSLDAACDSLAAAGDDQNTVHAILRRKE